MVNLDENKIWSNELNCYIIKYDVVVEYVRQTNTADQLEEVLRLVRDSTEELNNILKDAKL